MPPFTTKIILVPVDLRHSGALQKAIETAVYYAKQAGGSVSIITVA